MQDPAIVLANNQLRMFYGEVDKELKVLAQNGQEEGLYIQCGKGCAACCCLMVQATDHEAHVIIDAVNKLDGPVKARVIGRLKAYDFTIKKYMPKISVERMLEPSFRPGLLFQAQHFACPMLDDATHTCLIYADRPIACRTHHVTQGKPTDKSPCNKCAMIIPGEGCFVGAKNILHRHAPWVFQLRNDLISIYSYRLLRVFKNIGYGLMPNIVLGFGLREHVDWRDYPERPLYRMKSSKIK